ncbi:MAG: hypothetical protein MRY72_04350 [Aquisalinus sp.]|nr:hypothetical protein [Aquisalinus sp.]
MARKIAICTPIHRNTDADFTSSLLKTFRAVKEQLAWLNVVGQANIAHARNILVAEALKRGATDVVFIDSDIGWEPEAFSKLFHVPDECRIIAGAPQRRDPKSISFCSIPDQQEIKRHGHLLSGLAATAFLRIQTSVFDELDYAKTYHHPEGTCKSWFFHDIAPPREGEPDGFIASDFYFSTRCTQAGIDVWIDPDIQLRHYATVPLTSRLVDYLT